MKYLSSLRGEAHEKLNIYNTWIYIYIVLRSGDQAQGLQKCACDPFFYISFCLWQTVGIGI